MIKRVFLQCVCIMLLLVAQHGALTHAVWHANERLSASAHHGHDVEPGGQSAPDSSLCSFDFSFGEVMGGVSAACVLIATPRFDDERVAQFLNARGSSEAVAALSRGPPALLT